MTDETKKILYNWFNLKFELYDKLENSTSIYLYYEGEEYADIHISDDYKYIFYKYTLYEEFYEIVPVQLNEFVNIMSKWVEDTFNLKGFTPHFVNFGRYFWLKVLSR